MDAPPTVIVRKHVNALIPEAVPAFMASTLPGDVIHFFKRYGGIWLAGPLVLTTETLDYAPNRFNRALYKNASNVTIPLSRVAEVSDRGGVLMQIVDVRLDDGWLFSFRCFGAKRLVGMIKEAVVQARGAPEG